MKRKPDSDEEAARVREHDSGGDNPTPKAARGAAGSVPQMAPPDPTQIAPGSSGPPSGRCGGPGLAGR